MTELAGARELDPAEDDDAASASSAAWILAGQAGVVCAIAIGFGVTNNVAVKPNLYALLMIATAAAMTLLGPVGRVNRIMVSLPALVFLGWWALSVLWTYQVWAFLRDTQAWFPLIAAMIAFCSLLPRRDLERALVMGCYLSMAWAVAFTLAAPDVGLVHSDGSAGWPLTFGHKNLLAPFMLFAIITIAAFERRPARRWIAIAVAVALLVGSQSVTALFVGGALVVLAVFLSRVAEAPAASRSALLATGSLAGLAVIGTAMVYQERILVMVGRDPTLTSRTEIWGGVVEAIARRPLTGYGIGGVWWDPTVEPTRSILAGLNFTVYHAHNGYLEMMLQLGLVGLILYLILGVAVVRCGLALLDVDPALSRYILLFVALIAVTSITESPTFGIWIALLIGFNSLALRVLARAR